MRTRQDLLRAGAGVLALLVIAILLLGVWFERMATGAVNRWLSAAFPVPASLQKVKLRLPTGNVEAVGLRIGNPAGFAHREFLTLRKAEMEIRLSSLWTDEIVAENVAAEGLIVRLEKLEGRQNAREIFQSGTGKESKENEGKRFRIRRLVLRNTLLTYPVAGGEQVATVDRMEIEEPLGGNGAHLREAIARMAVRSLRAGAGPAAERGLAGFLPMARDGAGKPARAGKSVRGGNR